MTPRLPSLLSLCLCASVVISSAFSSGCASSARGPYAAQAEADRNPLEAQRLSIEAAAILDAVVSEETIPPGAPGQLEQLGRKAERLGKAESLLRQALTADLYCGPAHNNLGVIYLQQTPAKLYEAASEFSFAQKLMPGAPDPRLNLAITLERAGKYDDALMNYRSALEANAGHLPSMQALARLQIKHNRPDEKTPIYLQEIALRGDPAWSQWARARLAKATTRSVP